jgi:hypothetical protein
VDCHLVGAKNGKKIGMMYFIVVTDAEKTKNKLSLVS